eukprot:symbB.v1.2.021154.t1/scaffold1776.1/size101794/5
MPGSPDVELGANEDHLEEFFDALQEEVDRQTFHGSDGSRPRPMISSFSRNTSCSSFHDALSEWELEAPLPPPPSSEWFSGELLRVLDVLGIVLSSGSTAFAMPAPWEAGDGMPVLLMLFALSSIFTSLWPSRLRTWTGLMAGGYLYVKRWRQQHSIRQIEWIAAGIALSGETPADPGEFLDPQNSSPWGWWEFLVKGDGHIS